MQRMSDEDGVVAVVFAITLVVLVGVGALVVDAGNLYWERRQLQIGAEAGALAAAHDHVVGNGAAAAEASARAYASANNVRLAHVADIHMPTTNSVTVEAVTGDLDGAGSLTAFLAGVLGFDDYATRASATATWGAAGMPPSVIPLTVSLCDFAGAAGTYTPDDLSAIAATLPTVAQLEAAHGGTVTGGQIILLHDPHDEDDCTVAPGFSGEGETRMPGGFGWLELDTPRSACEVHVTAYEDNGEFWVPNRTGTYPEGKTCVVAQYQQAPLVPVFTGFAPPPVNEYRLYAPAAFYITGVRIPPGAATPTGMTCPGGPSVWCIQGHFVQKVDLGASLGTGPDLGVTAIALTG